MEERIISYYESQISDYLSLCVTLQRAMEIGAPKRHILASEFHRGNMCVVLKLMDHAP